MHFPTHVTLESVAKLKTMVLFTWWFLARRQFSLAEMDIDHPTAPTSLKLNADLEKIRNLNAIFFYQFVI